MAVLLRDLAGFYSGAVAPEPAPFSEYARWVAAQEGTEAHQRARRYWLDRLEGELPTLPFPTDRPRPALKTYRADRHDHPLSPELVQALKKLGARASASFFTVLLTAFATFLHQHVWSAPSSSPALAGAPQTRILDLRRSETQ